jgi:hypothetical protein
MTSAVNESPAIDVAVRHVPLTAMESPSDKPDTDFGALIVKMAELSPRVISFTVPSSLTKPVNI